MWQLVLGSLFLEILPGIARRFQSLDVLHQNKFYGFEIDSFSFGHNPPLLKACLIATFQLVNVAKKGVVVLHPILVEVATVLVSVSNRAGGFNQ